tara:strand:+ start:26 stop:436 length:411 start_codon:yes stop_codon:yes gene_type:complete
MNIIFYIICIILVNYSIIYFLLNQQTLFTHINNLRQTDIPNIYIEPIHNLLILFYDIKCNNLTDIKNLINIYIKLQEYINTIDTIYYSNDIIEIKQNFLYDLEQNYKLKIDRYNNSINYNMINLDRNIYMYPLIKS